MSITHADVMLSCADWRGQVVQRNSKGCPAPSRAAALAPALAAARAWLGNGRSNAPTDGGPRPVVPISGGVRRDIVSGVHLDVCTTTGTAGLARFEATLLIGFEATLVFQSRSQ